METTAIIRIVVGLIAVFVILPIVLVPYWKIFSKAGFSGALSILMIVPFLNLIVLYVVAFSEWKTISKRQEVGSQVYPTSQI